MLKEVDLRGTIAYVNDHPEPIKLVQDGKIDLADVVDHAQPGAYQVSGDRPGSPSLTVVG